MLQTRGFNEPALILQRQLSRRFGDLPPWALQRSAQANQAELEQWGDRVLDAGSLVGVFQPADEAPPRTSAN